MIRFKEDGARAHVGISPTAAELDSLENRPFNLFPSEDERKPPKHVVYSPVTLFKEKGKKTAKRVGKGWRR